MTCQFIYFSTELCVPILDKPSFRSPYFQQLMSNAAMDNKAKAEAGNESASSDSNASASELTNGAGSEANNTGCEVGHSSSSANSTAGLDAMNMPQNADNITASGNTAASAAAARNDVKTTTAIIGDSIRVLVVSSFFQCQRFVLIQRCRCSLCCSE